MKIGKYNVVETISFFLPKKEEATFQVRWKPPYQGFINIIVEWFPDDPEGEVEKGAHGVRWSSTTVNDVRTTKLTFFNLDAPLGGTMNKFASFGKMAENEVGFMGYFQTYETDGASFTLQFMIEEGGKNE